MLDGGSASPVDRFTSGTVNAYVPRIILRHLAADPGVRAWTVDGTVAFVDISGFTKLSERLAKAGREGAEQITEAIGGSFEAILSVAYMNGGGLIKFGGDALLLLFEGDGHLERAARATVLMRRILRDVGRIEVPGAKVNLRMSQGLHTGPFHFFLVGEVAPRAAADRSRLEPHRRDGARRRRRRDPDQPGGGRVAAGSLPGRHEGPGGPPASGSPRSGIRSRSPTRRSSYRRTWSPSASRPPSARTSRPAAAPRNIAR